MSTRHLRNVSIAQYESFLELVKCKFIQIESGHVKYFRSDLNRPIIFQSHIDPVPEFIIKNALRSLEISKKEFWLILDMKSEVVKEKGEYHVREIQKKDKKK